MISNQVVTDVDFSLYFPGIAREIVQNQLDKHAVKMVLETTQLLSTVLREWLEDESVTIHSFEDISATAANSSIDLDLVYKKFSPHHHCGRWAKILLPTPDLGSAPTSGSGSGEYSYNYRFLSLIGLEMCKEFRFRHNKPHKCEPIIEYCSRFYATRGARNANNVPPPLTKISPPPQCLPDEYKIGYSKKCIYIELTKKSRKPKISKGKVCTNHILLHREATLQDLLECQQAYQDCYFFCKRKFAAWDRGRDMPLFFKRKVLSKMLERRDG